MKYLKKESYQKYLFKINYIFKIVILYTFLLKICGPPGVGKTQFLFKICSTFLFNEKNKSIIYIDTENNFNPKR